MKPIRWLRLRAERLAGWLWAVEARIEYKKALRKAKRGRGGVPLTTKAWADAVARGIQLYRDTPAKLTTPPTWDWDKFHAKDKE